jgi:hypothetical protein
VPGYILERVVDIRRHKQSEQVAELLNRETGRPRGKLRENGFERGLPLGVLPDAGLLFLDALFPRGDFFGRLLRPADAVNFALLVDADLGEGTIFAVNSWCNWLLNSPLV